MKKRSSLGVLALPLLLSRALLLPFSRAVLFQPNNIGNILPNLSVVNGSIGHSSALWSLGLGSWGDAEGSAQRRRPAKVSPRGEKPGEQDEDDDREEDDSPQLITLQEMGLALDRAEELVAQMNNSSSTAIATGNGNSGSGSSLELVMAREGWNLIYASPLISLLKRRAKTAGRNPGPVEYLMLGQIKDVSPRTFLHAQINRQFRARWDKTMKAMETPGDSEAAAAQLIRGTKRSKDILYYRTKWPWPLKDRDYTLARRCRVFKKRCAIVLVSKSTEVPAFPSIEGVIRVDNYWCHSTIMSDRNTDDGSNDEDDDSSSSNSKNAVDRPGLRFVTVFCDDQKVPLPATLVDIISAQGEKVVPGSIERLCEVAREEQRLRDNK